MKKLLILLLSLLLIGCGNNKTSDDKVNFTSISANEAIKMMEELEEDKYIILDVRTYDEYASGHIDGAINLDNEEIQRGATPSGEKDMIYFVYCRSGNRSKMASSKLASMGYTNIYEMGGINSWPNPLVK